MLHVRTTAAPVDGQANEALVALIAKALRVPKSSISVVKGSKSRDKTVSLATLDTTEMAKRLQDL